MQQPLPQGIGALGAEVCPWGNGVSQQCFTSYKSAHNLLGEDNLDHCGTGFYILNKLCKEKQHVSSLHWKASQHKVCLPCFGNCGCKKCCEGEQQKKINDLEQPGPADTSICLAGRATLTHSTAQLLPWDMEGWLRHNRDRPDVGFKPWHQQWIDL